ncbi:retinol dehydrogenase 13-like isoform X1 [Branchiostoma floridae]|uniref:Retinol dehydrogenase 13-like isoform X1 n=2 Tax=Branchiostoma floridae TaxID=7739 RepID=A0A9J7KXF0_BRAFL|nr:retinol dehydrogenase 13-like isoform X1 [Branchiostoma floridae]
MGRLSRIAAIVVLAAAVLYVPVRRWTAGGVCESQARMDGKTVIITGANTGIGKVTARDMAQRGARVILACRSLEKAEEAAKEIRSQTGNKNVVVHKLDLASLTSVRQFAKVINDAEPRLDVLINNAGVMGCPRWETEDGFEMQFGVNHLGHFLLTNLLLDLLKKSAPSRVVTVSSLGHAFTSGIDFDDINYEKDYDKGESYRRSKLANVLFSGELARRLEGTGVTSNSLHPGVIYTELHRYQEELIHGAEGAQLSKVANKVIEGFVGIFGKTWEEGAQTTICCAVAEEWQNTTGLYFSDCVPKEPSAAGMDDEAAARLWDVSERMVGLKS